MFTTTPNATALIKAWEGFKPHAYPDLGKVWTIGFGTTFYRDGDYVMPGDEITEDEAAEELFYHVQQQVEPALDAYFGEAGLQPNERDALASFAYNLGTDIKGRWPTLARLVREAAPLEAIADQWMKYHRAGGEPVLGLHRRRMAEVLVLIGWPWEKAVAAVQGTSLDTEWRSVAGFKAKIDPELEIPELPSRQPDPVLFDPPKPEPLEAMDPTPETPLTQEDLNFIQYRKLGGKKPFRAFSLPPEKLKQVKPHYEPEPVEKAGTVDMKDTTRFAGEHNRQSGMDMQRMAAGATTAATGLTVLNTVADQTETLMASPVVPYMAGGLLAFAGVYFGIGWFRRWYGANQRYKGETEASQYMH